MNAFYKPVSWLVIAGVVVAVIAVMAGGGDTDEQRFDRLEIGMSIEEVDSILRPPSRRFHARLEPNLNEYQNINVNGRMQLTIRGGVLVHKEWLD